MRIKLFFLALAMLTLQLFAGTGQAALSKYAIRTTSLNTYGDVSPRVGILTTAQDTPSGTVVIDNDGGSGFPMLRKYKTVVGGGKLGTTVDLPGLSGFIFLRSKTTGGPADVQTGTGDIAADIEWGFIDSWTVAGGQFCRSIPSFVCGRADRVHDETVPPRLVSAKFDHHEWHFHPTGFRADPWISFTGTTDGNYQTIVRGAMRQDGTVPALPLVGIGAIGLSVVAMGLATLRRR
jgi:hypothetical protein